jgi:hypothetical protein
MAVISAASRLLRSCSSSLSDPVQGLVPIGELLFVRVRAIKSSLSYFEPGHSRSRLFEQQRLRIDRANTADSKISRRPLE